MDYRHSNASAQGLRFELEIGEIFRTSGLTIAHGIGWGDAMSRPHPTAVHQAPYLVDGEECRADWLVACRGLGLIHIEARHQSTGGSADKKTAHEVVRLAGSGASYAFLVADMPGASQQRLLEAQRLLGSPGGMRQLGELYGVNPGVMARERFFAFHTPLTFVTWVQDMLAPIVRDQERYRLPVTGSAARIRDAMLRLADGCQIEPATRRAALFLGLLDASGEASPLGRRWIEAPAGGGDVWAEICEAHPAISDLRLAAKEGEVALLERLRRRYFLKLHQKNDVLSALAGFGVVPKRALSRGALSPVA